MEILHLMDKVIQNVNHGLKTPWAVQLWGYHHPSQWLKGIAWYSCFIIPKFILCFTQHPSSIFDLWWIYPLVIIAMEISPWSKMMFP
jgi:hypothetical protein